MLETYYICTDKKSYKYALQYYKNEKTGILYCLTDEDFAQINELYNTYPDRNFYFFSSCAKGYLKANVNAIENFTDDYCELYAIPNPNKISTTDHKPEEIYFTNPDDRYKIFARLHIK